MSDGEPAGGARSTAPRREREAGENDGLWPPRGAAARAILGIAITVNLAASLAMATFLAPGTAAGGADPVRLAYIAEHLTRIRVGWFLWESATLSLVATFLTLARSLEGGEGTAGLRILAVALVALGAIPDSINNLINAAILPDIARAWIAADAPLRAALAIDFHLWDRAAVVLTGTLANGFYAAGGWLLLGASFRTRAYPRFLCWIQVPLWTATTAMAVSAAIDSLPGLIASVSVTMALFVLWGYGSAWLWLGRNEPGP